MAAVLIGLAILVILVLIAVKIGFSKEDTHINDPDRERMIRVSGVYSIVRESPRKSVMALWPQKEDWPDLVADDEDINGARLDDHSRAALLKHLNTQIEANLQTIENGDRDGVEFYYYDFLDAPCPVCKQFIQKGNFVTREEIYNHPEIIPPLHIGCACVLSAHRGIDNLRKTTISGMVPFFKNRAVPSLPNRISIVSLPATTEVNK